MQNKSLDYYTFQFSNINSDKIKESNSLNNLLDQLNALDCRSCNNPDNSKKMLYILSQCVSVVPPCETFLVAKTCQLLLTAVTRQSVQLEPPLLEPVVAWATQALEQSADLALLDILQALEAIISSCGEHLPEESVGELVAILSTQLEARASLTTPMDVKVWRVQCLTALARFVPLTHRLRYTETLWTLLRHPPTTDSDADTQVVRCVIEAVEALCQGDRVWLNENLGIVLGVVVGYLHCGLAEWHHQTPTKLFPLPGAQWDPPPAPNIKSKTKRRQKKRVSNIGAGVDVDDDGEERSVGQTPAYMAPPTALTWLTSDSDMSDSEGGRSRRLRRAQARVRLASINLLIHVAKVVNIRELFGYYSALVGRQGLSYNLVNDSNPRLSGVAASTIAFLLGIAKSYLAQAQHSRVTSYTPFSSVLASLLETLHHCVIEALNMTPSMSMLQCATCLVDITPYHRLQHGLLPPLLMTAMPLLRHKEVVVSVAVLTLLGVVAAVEPAPDELKELLASTSPPVQLPCLPEVSGCPWILSAALQYFKSDNVKAIHVPVRVEWWQVVTNIVRHHRTLMLPHLDLFVNAILHDTAAQSELVRLHATRTFQHITVALATMPEVDQTNYARVWSRALQPHLLGLVGISPFLTTAVCDCLGAMSGTIYQHLPERLQLCCLTTLLGCARDEDPAVRTAAVQALSTFLSFPTLAQEEQFVSDCSEVICLLVKDPTPLVSSKAAWALANLTDTLSKNQHGEEVVPLKQLIRTSLEAAQGKVKVKANGVRALGHLLGLLTTKNLECPEYRDLPLTAAQVLVQTASSTASMKVSWNACYALGSMLKNVAIHDSCSSWQGVVLPALCSLVVRSANFKVRSNACAALSSVPTRQHYSAHYLTVWRAVIQALDNTVTHTADFKEVKHQDSLLEQLCLSLCHLSALIEIADLAPLHEVVVYHMDTLQQHLSRFLCSTVPERADALLQAAANVAQLRDNADITLTSTQRDTLTILTDTLTFGV